MPRIIRCKIELDMVEAAHFDTDPNTNDLDAIRTAAEESFLDTINQLDNSGDLHEYVQSEIIDESD